MKTYKQKKLVVQELRDRRGRLTRTDSAETIACRAALGKHRHHSPPPTRLQQQMRADAQRTPAPITLPRLSILEAKDD